MPSAPLKNQHITIIYPIEIFTQQGYSRKKVEDWVKNAKGTVSTKLTHSTTHLIISANEWRGQGEIVREALSKNIDARKGKEIKIVNGEWLRASLVQQKKLRDGPYLWAKLEKGVMGGGKGMPARKDALDGSKEMRTASKPGNMADLLIESTEAYMDPREMEKIKRQNKEEERLKREVDEEREKEMRKRREEVRKIVGLGRRKAKNEVFSENWHLFVDDTCFPYDITLTKVDVASNRNDVVEITLKIQIYESNVEPHNYAVNIYHGGTGKAPANHLLAAIGSNFMTAMRVFKDAFSEQTGGVDWDRRLSSAVTRGRAERLAKSQGQKRAATSEETPFRYDPPRYGPRGRLTEEEKESFTEIGPQDRGYGPGGRPETRDNIELWLSKGIPAVPDVEEVINVTSQDEDETQLQELPSTPIVAARQPTAYEIQELARAEEAEEERQAQAMDDLNTALDKGFASDIGHLDFEGFQAVPSANNISEGNHFAHQDNDMALSDGHPTSDHVQGFDFPELVDLFPEEFNSLADQAYGEDHAHKDVGAHFGKQDECSQDDDSEQQDNHSDGNGNGPCEVVEVQSLSPSKPSTQEPSFTSFPHAQERNDAVQEMQDLMVDLRPTDVHSVWTTSATQDQLDKTSIATVDVEDGSERSANIVPMTLDLGSSLLGKRKVAESDEFGGEMASNKRYSTESML